MTDANSKAMIETGQRLVGLAYGYQTYRSAFEIALNPQVLDFVRKNPGLIDDSGEIPRRKGKGWLYSKIGWLENEGFLSSLEGDLEGDLASAWLSGALITAGDLLAKYHYFDRHPLLEMIRHLRNAVAHGNAFRIDQGERLSRFPANNQEAKFRGWEGESYFEITPELHSRKFMFDYMAPGDVLDVIASCGFLLQEQANASQAEE
jgi:hypothetical protein